MWVPILYIIFVVVPLIILISWFLKLVSPYSGLIIRIQNLGSFNIFASKCLSCLKRQPLVCYPPRRVIHSMFHSIRFLFNFFKYRIDFYLFVWNFGSYLYFFLFLWTALTYKIQKWIKYDTLRAEGLKMLNISKKYCLKYHTKRVKLLILQPVTFNLSSQVIQYNIDLINFKDVTDTRMHVVTRIYI